MCSYRNVFNVNIWPSYVVFSFLYFCTSFDGPCVAFGSHGAEEVDPSEDAPQPRRRAFVGAGYRLGQTGNDSEMVPGAPDNRPPQPRTVKLRLWRTGFSVDDGELREYADPGNQEFLNSVREG